MDASQFQPLGDYVLVEPDGVDELTPGGIALPENRERDAVETGTVVSAGPGKLLKDGARAPMSVKAGDRVIYSQYGGTDLQRKLGDKLYVLMHDDAIFGVLQQ